MLYATVFFIFLWVSLFINYRLISISVLKGEVKPCDSYRPTKFALRSFRFMSLMKIPVVVCLATDILVMLGYTGEDLITICVGYISMGLMLCVNQLWEYILKHYT